MVSIRTFPFFLIIDHLLLVPVARMKPEGGGRVVVRATIASDLVWSAELISNSVQAYSCWRADGASVEALLLGSCFLRTVLDGSKVLHFVLSLKVGPPRGSHSVGP